ncbi:MAG: LTA synthase family protein [Clostridia bacterium]|nr:LTA synthase family protein [Clostridia bacterium]
MIFKRKPKNDLYKDIESDKKETETSEEVKETEVSEEVKETEVSEKAKDNEPTDIKKGKWYNNEWLYFALSPILTIVMTSVIMGVDFVDGFMSNMFLTFVAKNLITYIILLSFTYLLSKILFKKIIAVYVVNIFLFIFAVATTICISKTGNPIMPGDFFMANRVGQMVGFIQIKISASMIWGSIILILILAGYTVVNKKLIIKKKQSRKQMIMYGILSFVIVFLNVYLLGFNTFVSKNILSPLGITISSEEPIKDYESNGLILFFVTHLSDLVVPVPEGYSDVAVREIIDKYELNINEFNEYTAPQNINVIAIQSETFWDVTRLPNVQYTVDPMQHFHRMSEQYISGYVVTPVLGCNTCMPEFEFLTGTSVTLFRKGSYPYVQYITDDVVAMPGVFANNGYTTRAIHTYDKGFYNRDDGYEYLAFEKFLGDEDLENPEYKGIYISEMEVTRLIIDEYENKGDKPLFLYAVTMQNHGGYMEERYDVYDVDVSSDVLNESELMQLKISAQGIYDIDKAFYALTEYFKNCSEPVMIVIYGDHLSYLGEGISVFEKTGYVSSPNLNENIQMYETPYLIWSNFDMSNIEVPKYLSPAKLGITTLKMAGLSKVPEHYGYLDKLYKEYPIIHPYRVVNSKGEITENLPEEVKREFNFIQYDYLVGEKYSGQLMN